ncbi:MAG: sugar ABC transporter ATP-binding protein [Christensenella sp.]|uniref:sugar ABC transporter ATP-binding protein n=1 Tax=Christensenella sp. TaxID=1935934 RepID=UPI002B1F95A7|nr:sugar ABC transporter ATP-binding protein [Christensenella sp.]MEA5004164.1 sugar ABC transporter ATP-binding protein [Christensenella sp.]
MDDYRVELLNIDKRFGGVYALEDVSLRVKKGTIHALVGENGAGKSTLMKVLSGAIQKDGGTIRLDGKEVSINNPREGSNMGIATIYQEFMLAPHLTVAENIFIDRLAQGGAFINWKKLKKEAAAILSKLGFGNINPNQRVSTLSVAYQQVVEICKNLSREAKVLVLDEPTAVLTFSEIEKLFGLIRMLRDQGVSIIYISHRLDEIFELCDTITVLKDGKFVRQVDTKDIDKQGLINSMVGRDLSTLFPTRDVEIGDVVMKVENLKVEKTVKDMSFEVRRGEVLGFSGLVGSGRTEAMHAIFGADKRQDGTVEFFGKNVFFKSPQQAVKNKLGLLPEDRKQQGVLLSQSIRINTTLSSLRKVEKAPGWIDKKKDISVTEQILKQLSTKYGSMEDDVSSLSGGNQQKVALAKWLAADCECIILDEPTRGVDVGAKVEIYKNINDLAAQGTAIIMISSEMEEIIGMCDRAIIMRQGRVVGELQKDELSENNLINLAMGV